jgi:hypothetical protein
VCRAADWATGRRRGPRPVAAKGSGETASLDRCENRTRRRSERVYASATKSAITDVRLAVMAGHVPATGRDRLSQRMAGTCRTCPATTVAGVKSAMTFAGVGPAMTVGQRAAAILVLSWCPRAGSVTAFICGSNMLVLHGPSPVRPRINASG